MGVAIEPERIGDGLQGLSSCLWGDHCPLINPSQMKWQETVRWMNAVRPYAWHWFEEHQKSECAEGGLGRLRQEARPRGI